VRLEETPFLWDFARVAKIVAGSNPAGRVNKV
jgi:hypothetical protein